MPEILLPLLFAYAFLTSFVLTAARRNEATGRNHAPALIRGAQLAFGFSVGTAALLLATAVVAALGLTPPPILS